MNNYKISFKSTQNDETSEYISIGTVSTEYGDTVVQYENFEGEDTYSTKIIIGNDIVSIVYSGQLESVLNFEKGKTHMTTIKTPLGSFEFGVKTIKLEKEVLNGSMNLFIEYHAFHTSEPDLYKLELFAEKI